MNMFDVLPALLLLVQICGSSGMISNFLSMLDEPKESTQNCMCVPYWQCKEDYSGLVEDEVDIMDVRVLHADVPSAPSPCTGDFDVCCKTECGRRGTFSPLAYKNSQADFSNILSFRILGDNNKAEFGEFPWMLGILEDRVFRCGASLIHPQVALTAAHCVKPQNAYKVRAGEWDWQTQDEPIPHQDRMSKKILLHPDYQPKNLHNDIALLILDSPFTLAENVGIVCLPPPPTSFDSSRCTATGWGRNSVQKGTYQPVLKKIELPVIPKEPCQTILQNVKLGPFFRLHESFICAGGEEKKDTCRGDGGGPLICPVDGDADRFVQAGIVAWGLTCGLADTPGVYVNVGSFREWIDGEMVKNGFDSNIYKV